MSHSDDLETRVANLEDQIAKLQGRTALAVSDAGTARLRAAATDQDVSTVRDELRLHTRALNVLRETQLEQGSTIAGLDQKVTEELAALITGVARITALLTGQADSEQDG